MIFSAYKDRFQIFLGIALILLLFDLLLLQRKTKWNSKINLYK